LAWHCRGNEGGRPFGAFFGETETDMRMREHAGHAATVMVHCVEQGTVRNFVRGWAVQHNQAIARVKRSPKRTANWALAIHHSRGGMIHSFSDRFKTRKSSFVAASSLGKWPLALTALRSFEFSASIAFVVYKIRRTSPGKA
jgi:hypothetical protein